jgi:cell fate regulator YaaT (PSP1 superfamily)
MKTVIGVRFKQAGKVYYFDPKDFEINKGDGVVVETVRGMEYGEVSAPPHQVPDEQVVEPLKAIIRVATAEDKRIAESNRLKEKDAFGICERKIQDHKLDMHLVDVEYAFGGGKITFYFTADGRVDFRELVKDLASVFKTRIELRQIGVRDEAKLLGGLGSCGRVVCCNAFLGDFHPVSIKMAKEQNLSLSPTKISGLCGRLMCCLKYEQEAYESTRKVMPRVGKELETPDGHGTVMENNVITERVKVRVLLSDNTLEIREYPIGQLRELNPFLMELLQKSAAPKNANKEQNEEKISCPRELPTEDDPRESEEMPETEEETADFEQE